jgi:hypothetical protein
MKVPTTLMGIAIIEESTVTRKRIFGRRNGIMEKKSRKFAVADGVVAVVFVGDTFKGVKTVAVQANSLKVVVTRKEDDGNRKRKVKKKTLNTSGLLGLVRCSLTIY